ncbi:4-hydroxythreonine-4-phosphate dehydrogenase PdxA [Hippea jasoniae]|uniref:4-hydroxythreonine-4-phosphate dehydrogenase PdxA n=1 Tax=Hippea jasoniae TaxID=944479 RepID=UPI0005558AC9|nr:4-hydroxythreonine-4-phosphate dehydrogenase PdxA [Hippea jasoniae]
MSKPILGVSMGDAAGIGPEIILKQIIYENNSKYKLIIFGKKSVFEFYLDLFNLAMPINTITTVESINQEYKEGEINIIEVEGELPDPLPVGRLSGQCGDVAFRSFKAAVDAAKSDYIDAIITAPINKEAINLAGHKYMGHTDALAEMTNTTDYVMMLAAKRFRIALVTTHIPLKDVPKHITTQKVLKTIEIVHSDLNKWFGIENPQIAIAGLNPHSSDGGIMGDEEELFIKPAIRKAKEKGIAIEGPFPADTMFIKNKSTKFDCFICMYHDQGLPVLKALYFDTSVNITLGIPIIRTSPDHGTAFDIAGKFIASHKSFSEAIKQAYRMARWKQKRS